MTLGSSEQTAIIRTERGLTIAGTRITIYDVMDHLTARRSPELVLNWLPLTKNQLESALSYIETNRNVLLKAKLKGIMFSDKPSGKQTDWRSRWSDFD